MLVVLGSILPWRTRAAFAPQCCLRHLFRRRSQPAQGRRRCLPLTRPSSSWGSEQMGMAASCVVTMCRVGLIFAALADSAIPATGLGVGCQKMLTARTHWPNENRAFPSWKMDDYFKDLGHHFGWWRCGTMRTQSDVQNGRPHCEPCRNRDGHDQYASL